jgi:alkylation response protein AidB-like acyl-CoA dehydrogenase
MAAAEVYDISLAPRDDANSRAAAASALVTDGFGRDVADTLRTARDVARLLRNVDTATRWEVLAALAARDVSGARMIEPHLDAALILSEAVAAGTDDAVRALAADENAAWGVFAAEGPGHRLEAHRTGGGWRLRGTKVWCSLASDLDRALVTAWLDDEQRALFAVDLLAPGVHPHAGPWVPSGLAGVVSAPVHFDDVPADAVRPAEWYLSRAGFAWGGVGVAAVWWGATLPLVARLADAARRDGADQLAAVYLGRADAASWAARTALADAALRADGMGEEAPALIAARVRATVAETARQTIELTARALGPAPLVSDEPLARRLDDLRVYLAQDHGDRDLARLGRKRVQA